MAIAPAGSVSLSLVNLQTLIADCSSFQSWVGAADAETAKHSIHLVNIADEEVTRPFALIDLGEKWTSKNEGMLFGRRGEIKLLFEDDVAPENTESYGDAKIDFTNHYGSVLDEMESLSLSGGYLNIDEVELEEEPERSVDDEDVTEGDFYRVVLTITWWGV